MAVSSLSFTVPRDCLAETPWPTGKIHGEVGLHEQFGLGQIQSGEIAAIRVVRFSDALESPPSEWLIVKQAEQEVIALNADIKIVEASLAGAADSDVQPQKEPRKSPCPVMGALVAFPRLPSQETAILFFYLYDESMVLVSPPGWSISNDELRKMWTKRFPKLLRRTRGARLAHEDATESDNTVDRVYYRDGSLRTQVPLKDGKRHGVGCSMFKSGGVSFVLPYAYGEIDGTVQSYTEGGNLLSETRYERGKKHGAERFYNVDGSLLGTNWWLRDSLVQEESFQQEVQEDLPSSGQ